MLFDLSDEKKSYYMIQIVTYRYFIKGKVSLLKIVKWTHLMKCEYFKNILLWCVAFNGKNICSTVKSNLKKISYALFLYLSKHTYLLIIYILLHEKNIYSLRTIWIIGYY